MIAIKPNRTFRAFSGHFLFAKKNVFVVALILRSCELIRVTTADADWSSEIVDIQQMTLKGGSTWKYIKYGEMRIHLNFFFCMSLRNWVRSGSENKSHRFDFLWNYRSCPLPEIVRDNTLQIWRSIPLHRSSKAKITSDVLRASLNSSFKDYWHLRIKRNM
jgi:hypothetical protein